MQPRNQKPALPCCVFSTLSPPICVTPQHHPKRTSVKKNELTRLSVGFPGALSQLLFSLSSWEMMSPFLFFSASRRIRITPQRSFSSGPFYGSQLLLQQGGRLLIRFINNKRCQRGPWAPGPLLLPQRGEVMEDNAERTILTQSQLDLFKVCLQSI